MNNNQVVKNYQKAEGKRIRKKADKKAKMKDRKEKQKAMQKHREKDGKTSWTEKIKGVLSG